MDNLLVREFVLFCGAFVGQKSFVHYSSIEGETFCNCLILSLGFFRLVLLALQLQVFKCFCFILD